MYDISGGICLLGGIVYLIFGSCELQKWAKNQDEEDILEENLDFDTEVSYDSEIFTTEKYQWPTITKQDGRLLFVNTITQPFANQYFIRHKDLLY